MTTDELDRICYDYIVDGLKAIPANAGKPDTKQLADGWTVVTKDRSLSAQWEHMVAVTQIGFEILTSWPDRYGDYLPITAPITVEASLSAAMI